MLPWHNNKFYFSIVGNIIDRKTEDPGFPIDSAANWPHDAGDYMALLFFLAGFSCFCFWFFLLIYKTEAIRAIN